MSAPVSVRTVVRDLVRDTLTRRRGLYGLRLAEYDVSSTYLSIEECARYPTYCVVVTDETVQGFTQQQRACQMMVTVVCYARHETDVRAMLDAAIEDVYDAMLTVQQQLTGVAWQLTLDGITTDDHATATKPHAQAVQRWTCLHGRAPK